MQFIDSAGTKTGEGNAGMVGPCWSFVCPWTKTFTIPAGAALGLGFVRMSDKYHSTAGRGKFTVTGSATRPLVGGARHAFVQVRPQQGPPGTSVKVKGGFFRNSIVKVRFVDSNGVRIAEGLANVSYPCYTVSCYYTAKFVIPAGASLGVGFVRMVSNKGQSGRTRFTVTGS